MKNLRDIEIREQKYLDLIECFRKEVVMKESEKAILISRLIKYVEDYKIESKFPETLMQEYLENLKYVDDIIRFDAAKDSQVMTMTLLIYKLNKEIFYLNHKVEEAGMNIASLNILKKEYDSVGRIVSDFRHKTMPYIPIF